MPRFRAVSPASQAVKSNLKQTISSGGDLVLSCKASLTGLSESISKSGSLPTAKWRRCWVSGDSTSLALS
jgi:hypothetical protein